MQNSQTQALTVAETLDVVDSNDVISAKNSSLALMVNALRNYDGPMLIQEQFLMNFDAETQETLSSAYGSEPVPFKAFANRDVKVLGIIIEEHGAYNGKDGLYHPEGFFRILFLTDIENASGQLTVIKSSSSSLGLHVLHILANRGWYLFDEPITYRFSLGAESNAHSIYNVSHDVKATLLGKKGKKKNATS